MKHLQYKVVLEARDLGGINRVRDDVLLLKVANGDHLLAVAEVECVVELAFNAVHVQLADSHALDGVLDDFEGLYTSLPTHHTRVSTSLEKCTGHAT